MERHSANEIIQQYKLISGKMGREILYAIENKLPMDDKWSSYISQAQFDWYTERYNRKCEELGAIKYPRHFIFYHLIKEKFPDFSWELQVGKSANNQCIAIHSPRVRGLRPSLASLLFGRVDPKLDSLIARKYRCAKLLPTQIVGILSDVLQEMDVIYPSEESMGKLVSWVNKGLNQEQLTLFSPICPDYSVEETGNPACPFRHTFNELGSGLGLIAQRILHAIPKFLKALTACGLRVKVVIGIGDFEAYSDANLNRLNITQAVFLERVAGSKKAFEEASLIDVDVRMITDMLGGFQNWQNRYHEFVNHLQQRHFGLAELNERKLLSIVGKRKNLYDRWYGKKSLVEHIPQLLNQGAEYAVLGAMAKLMENCLVLGADNDAMAPFYSVDQPIPTLYLKRYYC